MEENVERSIEATRKGFEQSFKEGSLYNKQTQSDNHLRQIVEALNIKPGSKILDLGTGSGYLAFEVAKKFKECEVTGLDIVVQTLEVNKEEAVKRGFKNISFVAYDGVHFPFEEEEFDYVLTRYALHHFPKIEETFKEISRILKQKGQLFIADPTPCEGDYERFVDRYMQMKKDGHIKYYTKTEFIDLAAKANMELKAAFETTISFPRVNESGYESLIKRHSKEVIEKYKVYVTEDNQYIYITQNVLNLTFEKQ